MHGCHGFMRLSDGVLFPLDQVEGEKQAGPQLTHFLCRVEAGVTVGADLAAHTPALERQKHHLSRVPCPWAG